MLKESFCQYPVIINCPSIDSNLLRVMSINVSPRIRKFWLIPVYYHFVCALKSQGSQRYRFPALTWPANTLTIMLLHMSNSVGCISVKTTDFDLLSLACIIDLGSLIRVHNPRMKPSFKVPQKFLLIWLFMLTVLGPRYNNCLLIITPQTVTTLHSNLKTVPIKP